MSSKTRMDFFGSLCVAFGLFFISCIICPSKFYAQESTLPRAPYILPQTVKEWLKKGEKLVIVDVREPSEYEAGHIKNAINIPYYDLEDRLQNIPHDIPYILYCIHSSWRAPYAGNLMADHAYTNVYILEGGIAAWNAGGQVIFASNRQDKGVVAKYPDDVKKVLKHPQPRDYSDPVVLTSEELSVFDGKDGRPAYVAVDGVIYDVTTSRLWRGGEHDPSHGKAMAGRDLTTAMEIYAPHGDEHLKRFPVVGRLEN